MGFLIVYGKIFDTMYDGTLAEDWRALITFQQFIVLCDADGVIDMTPSAISRRTGIPIEHIKAGIEILENKDEYSRTPGDDGRRIMLIDDHRPWGWYIVNHSKYKNMVDASAVREQNRERKRRQRERQKETEVNEPESVNMSRDVTDGHGCHDTSRHTDTDTDTNKSLKHIVEQEQCEQVISYLNERAGRNYQLAKTNINFVKARLKAGATIEQCLAVIDSKVDEWKDDSSMYKFLRPATLFNETKFSQYVGEIGVEKPADKNKHNSVDDVIANLRNPRSAVVIDHD